MELNIGNAKEINVPMREVLFQSIKNFIHENGVKPGTLRIY